MKEVRPYAPAPLPPGNIPGTRFCQPQGHSAAEKIMPMKNSSDTTGDQSRDLPPPRVPVRKVKKDIIKKTAELTDHKSYIQSTNLH
jgi:hypothetical protein